MTRYQVDSEAVMAATGAAQATVGRIEGEVSALHGQLIALQGSWTGAASSAFQLVVSEWKATEARVLEGLAGISQALGLAAEQYTEIELSNARLFQH